MLTRLTEMKKEKWSQQIILHHMNLLDYTQRSHNPPILK
jgi:hypothetical protein